MTRAAVILSLAALVASVSIAAAETLMLRPVEVADVAGETNGCQDARLLMAFDLGALPKGALIEYAGLRLTEGSGVAWKNPHVPVVVAAMTTGWDESASWDGPSAGESWQNPGGDWNAEYRTYRVLVSKARTPAKFLMTTLARAWQNGSLANHGLIAMIEEVADLQDVVPYFNAETLKPTLEIRYLLPQTDQR